MQTKIQAQNTPKIVQGSLDFSKGKYKKIYDRWHYFHFIEKENLGPKFREKKSRELLALLEKTGIDEIELIYWFANHKQK